MAPTRHQETGPAAASPHAALSHSGGCDRDGGEQRKREGEALKETAAAAQGAAGDMGQGRVGSPVGEEGAPGVPGQLGGGLEPPDGDWTLFPTSTFQMPAISSSASASQCLPLSGTLGSPVQGRHSSREKKGSLEEGVRQSGAACSL